ncbi:MAG TPA: hypothetical protein VGV59_18065 [Pyrinomonadaceae bacterium]|nr:hypothetical protein [Pyrinomonadaceae bacterium]
MRWRLVSACAALCAVLSVSAVAPAQQQWKKMRSVRGQVLTSPYQPPVRLKFNRAFKYVGRQYFVLYERARAEQFYFVDADRSGRIRRLYIVQFEGFLSNAEGRYDYSNQKTVELGGETYAANAQIVPSITAVLKQNPDSDAARAVAFLRGKGYEAGESVMFQRFVRVLDETRRNEFIIIYVEDLSGTGLRAADFDEGGKAAAQKDRILEGLSARALKGFVILK